MLPPRHEAVVPVAVPASHHRCVLIEPVAMTELGAAVGASLCRSDAAAVRICNPTERHVRLPAGTTVGTTTFAAFDDENEGTDLHSAAVAPTGTGRSRGLPPMAPPSGSADDIERSVREVNYGVTGGQRRRLEQHVRRHADVYTTRLGRSKSTTMIIPTGDAAPVFARNYRLSTAEKAAIDTEVTRLLGLGVVEAAASRWCSRLVLVPKKCGGLRVCCDWRAVNARLSESYSFPLPAVAECLEGLAGKRWFASLDLAHGYWQVPLADEASKDRTAFMDGRGRQWRFNVMGMGLRDSGSIFQQLVSSLVAHVPGAKVYCDDVLASSSTFDGLVDALDAIAGAFRAEGLTIKPEKSFLGFNELKYLGFIVGRHGVRLDPELTEKLRAKGRPTTLKEGQRLLGLLNWCRPGIVGFAERARPINDVVKPSIRWKKDTWGAAQDAALDDLISAVEAGVRLAHPTTNDQFVLYTDASAAATGAVLCQRRSEDGVERILPVAFESALNSEAESRYSPTELEAMAIIKAVKKFRPFLHGARPFEIVTDHRALEFITSDPNKSGRLARWYSSLLEFQYTVVHRKGAEMAFVDMLSRPPFPETWRAHTGVDALARPHELTGKQQCVHRAVGATTTEPVFDPAATKTAQHSDPLCTALQSTTALAAAPKHFQRFAKTRTFAQSASGMLVAVGPDGSERVVVPAAMRPAVLRAFHDDAGHPGTPATAAAVARSCAWPELHRDVVHYIRSCPGCKARFASSRGAHNTVGKLPSASRMGEAWFMDSIHAVQKGTGKPVLVITAVDAFTRWAETTVVASTKAETSFDEFLSTIRRRYGVPSCVITDDGPEFKAEFRRGVAAMGVKHHVTTAAARSSLRSHLGISPVERFHRTLWSRIALIAPTSVEDWKPYIAEATAAYNCARSSVSDTSPFEEMFSVAPRTAADAAWQLRSDEADTLRRVSEAVEARAAAAEARRSDVSGSRKSFNVGDLVWARLDLPRAHDVQPQGPRHKKQKHKTSEKLLFPFTPATVTAVSPHSTTTYTVRNEDTGRELSRSIHDLHDRYSRRELLMLWDCDPFEADFADPGDGTELAPAPPPDLVVRHTTRKCPRRGDIVLIGQAFANTGPAPELEPVAISGRVTRWDPATKRAAIEWCANADDERAPSSTVRMPATKCLGLSDTPHGTMPEDSWAFYDGPSTQDGAVLQRIVASKPRRQHDGAVLSMFRCRTGIARPRRRRMALPRRPHAGVASLRRQCPRHVRSIGRHVSVAFICSCSLFYSEAPEPFLRLVLYEASHRRPTRPNQQGPLDI